MKKQFEVRPLFFQYLTLFMTAAFLPVVIACTALLISNRALNEEIIYANQASVTLTQQALDSKIAELQNMLYQIDQDPSLTRYALEHSPRSAITTLNKYAQHHDSIRDILIYVHDTESFYGATGAFHLRDIKYQSFVKDLTRHSFAMEDWLEVLNLTSSPTYWPVNCVGQTSSYLYYFSPIYANFQYTNSSPSRTLVLLIRQDFIHKLFQSSQTNMEESVLLFNSEMELISQFAPNSTEQTIQDICAFITGKKLTDQSTYLEFADEDLMLFVTKSQSTGLCYVRFLPKKVAFHAMYKIRLYSALILLAVILVGTLLIILGIKKSYDPIRSLADQVRQAYPQKEHVKNELLLFNLALEDSFEKNLLLNQALAKSRYSMIDHLLSTLIQGKFPSYEAFQNTCRDLSVHLDKQYFAVCTILFEMESAGNIPPGNLDFEQILKIIVQNLPNYLQIQVKDLLFARKLILVISSDTNDTEVYCNEMRAIQNRLSEGANLPTSMALGAFYDTFDNVGKSYLDSMNALDYRMVYGKKCFIAPDSYNTSFEKNQYPFDRLDSLHYALMSKSKEKLIESVYALRDYTKSSNCSLHIAKYICYDAFSILKKDLHSISAEYSLLPQLLSITALTSFDTIDEFFVSYVDAVQSAIPGIPAQKENAAILKPKLEQQVTDYITEHCFDYSFQINQVAELFSVTPQYLRRVFKDINGRTISEYVANLKMEKAMLLLRESDKNLQDIVMEIGNTDVSGFIRLFKQKTGMTPGQYRKSSRQKDSG